MLTLDYVKYIARVCYGYPTITGRTVIKGENLKFLRYSNVTLTGIIPQSLLVANIGLMDDAIFLGNFIEDRVSCFTLID